MFCNNCGKKIFYNNKKCKNCGEKIIFEDIGKGLSFDEPVLKNEEVPTAEVQAEVKSVNNLKIISAVVAAVFVFAVGSLIYNAVNNQDEDDSDPNPTANVTSTSNGGDLFDEDEESKDEKKSSKNEDVIKTCENKEDGYKLVYFIKDGQEEIKIEDKDGKVVTTYSEELMKQIKSSNPHMMTAFSVKEQEYEFGYLGNGVFVATKGAYLRDKEVGSFGKIYSTCFLIGVEANKYEKINATHLSIVDDEYILYYNSLKEEDSVIRVKDFTKVEDEEFKIVKSDIDEENKCKIEYSVGKQEIKSIEIGPGAEEKPEVSPEPTEQEEPESTESTEQEEQEETQKSTKPPKQDD